ncbi:MAG: [protein-PII] uridylyltransferase [Acidimicrobiales bacterium]
MLADVRLVGGAFVDAYSDAADSWLRDLVGPSVEGVALVAVGGYGRRELCPRSDLDLALVHRGLPAQETERLAERIWYPLWDVGVRIDHSVRSLREALRLAGDELEVATGLLDARVVWGDPDLVSELAAGVRSRWQAASRRRVGELADTVAARHRDCGDVAFMLEPDLKEGRGGLRDLVALRAAAAGTPVIPDLTGAEAAGSVLLSARVELHRRTRRGDRLLLEEQDGIAEALGYGDADELMAAVARAARTIGRVGDDAWRRARSWIEGPRGRQGSADRPLGPSLALRDGEVVLVSDAHGSADADRDRSLVWRAAAASAETGATLARATVAALAGTQPVQVGTWPTSARTALVALLATGGASIPVFEELDEAGLLVRLLPEWEPVRSRPQRNAFHRFTVDRHLCEAAAASASMARDVGRPDLLMIGAWLHDIGKGYPGDHTEVGMVLVERIATRMGFGPDDTATLVSMVEHHLLLPDVATRRDLDDPATINAVAGRVRSAELLCLLAALAKADGTATGPAAWSAWKERLIDDLVARVGRRLAGDAVPPAAAPLERSLRTLPAPQFSQASAALREGRLAVIAADERRVAVIAPDRPGLLGLIAGVFVVDRMVVLGALCATDGGMVIDVFEVEHELGEQVDPALIHADLERALDGRLPVAVCVAERARAYSGRNRRNAAIPASRRVNFEALDDATLVEVRAPDDLGLLHRVAGALAQCGLDVRSAKVDTHGHEVVDAFTVTEAGGPLPVSRYPVVESVIMGWLSRGARLAAQ